MIFLFLISQIILCSETKKFFVVEKGAFLGAQENLEKSKVEEFLKDSLKDRFSHISTIDENGLKCCYKDGPGFQESETYYIFTFNMKDINSKKEFCAVCYHKKTLLVINDKDELLRDDDIGAIIDRFITILFVFDTPNIRKPQKIYILNDYVCIVQEKFDNFISLRTLINENKGSENFEIYQKKLSVYDPIAETIEYIKKFDFKGCFFIEDFFILIEIIIVNSMQHICYYYVL